MVIEQWHFEEEQVIDTPKKNKKEQADKKPEQDKKVDAIDQQKFIENKFIRLDSVFKKEQKNVTYEKWNPTAPLVLDTKRGTISFHIEKDWGGGRNAEVTIKDWWETYKILLEYPESSLSYQMSVFKENSISWKKEKKTLVKIPQPMANNKATEYISML